MHILVCDDDAAFSAKVAEYAATYFEAHEIPVQATVCSDPEQVLAIPVSLIGACALMALMGRSLKRE